MLKNLTKHPVPGYFIKKIILQKIANNNNKLTSGLSATCLAHVLIILMASMLVSGYEALHANSAKHLMASWNESMVASKCDSNIDAMRKRRERKREGGREGGKGGKERGEGGREREGERGREREGERGRERERKERERGREREKERERWHKTAHI